MQAEMFETLQLLDLLKIKIGVFTALQLTRSWKDAVSPWSTGNSGS